jgi:hypothetical protein
MRDEFMPLRHELTPSSHQLTTESQSRRHPCFNRMAINLFGSYCIVVRKSERTVPWEERARAHLAEVNRRFMERNPDHTSMPPFEDEALFAFPAGQGPRDAE